MPGAVPVDLTQCDREPLRVRGSIQPHGAMRVLKAATLTGSGDCDIHWRASDGLPVSPLSPGGFGTKPIKNPFEYDLWGEVCVTHPPDGVLRARVLLPAVLINELPAPAVEDQLMIAMDIERARRQLGSENVVFAPQADEALALLAQSTPDAAVLDFNPGGQGCEVVADVPRRQGLAFVFATGYGDGVLFPERFRPVPAVDGSALAVEIAQVRDTGCI